MLNLLSHQLAKCVHDSFNALRVQSGARKAVHCQNYEDLDKDIRMDALSWSSQIHVIGAHYTDLSRRKHACAATPLRMVTGNTIFGASKNSSTPAASQFIKEEIRLEICGTSTRSSCE